MSVWRLGWRVSQHEPRSFWSGYLLFVLFFTFPVLSGWLLGRGFNALSTGHNSRVYWIGAAGDVLTPLDEAKARADLAQGFANGFRAVAIPVQSA